MSDQVQVSIIMYVFKLPTIKKPEVRKLNTIKNEIFILLAQ